MALVHAPTGWDTRTDPDLVRLVLNVAKVRDVWVVQADRTIVQEQDDIDRGVSHLKDPTDSYHVIVPGVRDLALAVDLAPVIGGKIPWNDRDAFIQLAALVKCVAQGLSITPFSWGGDWPHPFDYDHYQKAPAPV